MTAATAMPTLVEFSFALPPVYRVPGEALRPGRTIVKDGYRWIVRSTQLFPASALGPLWLVRAHVCPSHSKGERANLKPKQYASDSVIFWQRVAEPWLVTETLS